MELRVVGLASRRSPLVPLIAFPRMRFAVGALDAVGVLFHIVPERLQ